MRPTTRSSRTPSCPPWRTRAASGARTGWSPLHLLVERPGGGLLAAAPCYLKGHSQGEYVFDYAWADAYARAGGRYYPKLQVAVPFTPVTGPRLLVPPGPEADRARETLTAGLRALRAQTGASSVHVTFAGEPEAASLEEAGFLHRTDQQFHWFNEGYGTFDGFLEALASRKRKAIRRERRDAMGPGIAIERLTGRDITEAHWDAFFRFYMDTGSRKWGRPYLNRKFFSLVGERMGERVLLVMAKRDGRYIAGAINFVGDRRLYGRNWGCIEDHPFLHFEVCYYQAIDFAIERKLSCVEAGAQGEHKLSRGYRPVTTHSAHDFADAGLAPGDRGLPRPGARLRGGGRGGARGGGAVQAGGGDRVTRCSPLALPALATGPNRVSRNPVWTPIARTRYVGAPLPRA